MFRRAVTVAAGLILLERSMRRRTPRSWLAGLVGIRLILLGLQPSVPRRIASCPSRDTVELASQLSFPASDAPAY